MAIKKLLDISRALADGNRIRLLAALRGRELCVCQLVELLDLAPSTVSRHLAILRQADLLLSRKKGRWVHYRRPETAVTAMIRDALEWLDTSLERDQEIREDTRRLRKILRIPVEEICRLQSRR